MQCGVEVNSEIVILQSFVEDGKWLCCPDIGCVFVPPLSHQDTEESWLHWLTFECSSRWGYQPISWYNGVLALWRLVWPVFGGRWVEFRWWQRWGLESATRTRVALNSHSQRLQDLIWTHAQKTSDSTQIHVLGLVNCHFVFFFRRINIEKTLKPLTSIMCSFLFFMVTMVIILRIGCMPCSFTH